MLYSYSSWKHPVRKLRICLTRKLIGSIFLPEHQLYYLRPDNSKWEFVLHLLESKISETESSEMPSAYKYLLKLSMLGLPSFLFLSNNASSLFRLSKDLWLWAKEGDALLTFVGLVNTIVWACNAGVTRTRMRWYVKTFFRDLPVSEYCENAHPFMCSYETWNASLSLLNGSSVQKKYAETWFDTLERKRSIFGVAQKLHFFETTLDLTSICLHSFLSKNGGLPPCL